MTCHCLPPHSMFNFLLVIILFLSSCSNFQFNEEARSPFVKKFKTIIHPGEVSILSTCSVPPVSWIVNLLIKEVGFYIYILVDFWPYQTQIIFIKVDIDWFLTLSNANNLHKSCLIGIKTNYAILETSKETFL